MEWLSNIELAEHVKTFALLATTSVFTAALIWRTSLKETLKVLWHHFRNHHVKRSHLIENMVLVSHLFPTRSPQLEPTIAEFRHPFLKESFRLISEGVFDEKAVKRILDVRMDFHYDFQRKQVERLKAMARIPTAFGLAGTVWFTAHGNMAGAGVLILHSIFLSYLILLPLADLLKERIQDEMRTWTMIAQGAKLVLSRANPVAVSEELNSYVAQNERVQWNYQSLPAGKKAS